MFLMPCEKLPCEKRASKPQRHGKNEARAIHIEPPGARRAPTGGGAGAASRGPRRGGLRGLGWSSPNSQILYHGYVAQILVAPNETERGRRYGKTGAESNTPRPPSQARAELQRAAARAVRAEALAVEGAREAGRYWQDRFAQCRTTPQLAAAWAVFGAAARRHWSPPPLTHTPTHPLPSPSPFSPHRRCSGCQLIGQAANLLARLPKKKTANF